MFVVISVCLLDCNYRTFVLHFFSPVTSHFTQNKNIIYDIKIQFRYVKVKVKVTLVQALRLCYRLYGPQEE